MCVFTLFYRKTLCDVVTVGNIQFHKTHNYAAWGIISNETRSKVPSTLALDNMTQ